MYSYKQIIWLRNGPGSSTVSDAVATQLLWTSIRQQAAEGLKRQPYQLAGLVR